VATQAATDSPQTVVRYVARCRSCPRRGAVDAAVYTVRVQGRDYMHRGIAYAPEDYADAPILSSALGYVRMPQPPARTGFQLDMHGVARRALIRVGLWCTDCGCQMKVNALKATRNDAKPCGERCQNATAITCDCACGGARHASAWAV